MNTPLSLYTTPFTTDRRPYSRFSSLSSVENGANANYHGFEVSIRHPFRDGFYLQGSLSLNRDRSEVGHTSGWSPETQSIFGIDYAYDRAREMGRTLAWTNGAFHLNWVYEVPLGRGKKFASNASPVLNAMLGEWAVSGVYVWRSGHPFTPTYSGYDPAGINQYGGRPNLVAGCDAYDGGKNLGSGALWFNPKCFSIPKPGTLGNVELGSLVGPGAWTLSVNPYKSVAITDRLKLRIGAKITNILNHPVYAYPVSNITSSNAGRITGKVEILRAPGDGMRSVTLVAGISF